MDNIKLSKNKLQSKAIKFELNDEGKFVGRAYLYLIENDLHDKPYGLLEDVFVSEDYRGNGYGTKLVNLVIDKAKEIGCTKLISTSRKTRPQVHQWYKKIGFQDYGVEFRIDL